MTRYASYYIQKFFEQHLILHRNVSQKTVSSYSTCFKLLIKFAATNKDKAPSQLLLIDLDLDQILAFLSDLETRRNASISTRNNRLAAIRSFCKFLSFEEPGAIEQCRSILGIQSKRGIKKEVNYLKPDEIDALLTSTNSDTWYGVRDHAIMFLLLKTGLRVSELIALDITELNTDFEPSIRVLGKGRKERSLPLMKDTMEVLGNWISTRPKTNQVALFTTTKGNRLSVDSIQRIVRKYSSMAEIKKVVSPHVLRHTAAMEWRRLGMDIVTISLILGHESIETTMIYFHADLDMKRREMARVGVMDAKFGQFRPKDNILSFLDSIL